MSAISASRLLLIIGRQYSAASRIARTGDLEPDGSRNIWVSRRSSYIVLSRGSAHAMCPLSGGSHNGLGDCNYVGSSGRTVPNAEPVQRAQRFLTFTNGATSETILSGRYERTTHAMSAAAR